MKPNELMIGDWVAYNGDVDYINPIKIEGMDIATGMCITSDRDDVGFDGVDPIPLTAEILEKNGFDISDKEVMQYHFEEDGEKYHFSLRQMYDKDGTPHGYSFYAFNVLTIIDYVHELQHALRLCNIEKEIEL